MPKGAKNPRIAGRLDLEDMDLLSTHSWYLSPTGYLIAYRPGSKTVQTRRPYFDHLHRLVLARVAPRPTSRHVPDHINGDPTDNRRANLRWVTPAQSSWNTRKRRGALFKGVYQLKRAPFTFTAQICGKYIGIYPTAEDAARAYDREAVRRGGIYAKLNFPHA